MLNALLERYFISRYRPHPPPQDGDILCRWARCLDSVNRCGGHRTASDAVLLRL